MGLWFPSCELSLKSYDLREHRRLWNYLHTSAENLPVTDSDLYCTSLVNGVLPGCAVSSYKLPGKILALFWEDKRVLSTPMKPGSMGVDNKWDVN